MSLITPRPQWRSSHIVCPVVQFQEWGKTRLTVSRGMADQIAETLGLRRKSCTKKPSASRKMRVRAHRAAQTQEHREHAPLVSLKEAVFEVLPEALARATGACRPDYPVSARKVYYQVRPLIQSLTKKALDYDSYLSAKFVATVSRGARCHSRPLLRRPKRPLRTAHGPGAAARDPRKS